MPMGSTGVESRTRPVVAELAWRVGRLVPHGAQATVEVSTTRRSVKRGWRDWSSPQHLRPALATSATSHSPPPSLPTSCAPPLARLPLLPRAPPSRSPTITALQLDAPAALFEEILGVCKGFGRHEQAHDGCNTLGWVLRKERMDVLPAALKTDLRQACAAGLPPLHYVIEQRLIEQATAIMAHVSGKVDGALKAGIVDQVAGDTTPLYRYVRPDGGGGRGNLQRLLPTSC